MSLVSLVSSKKLVSTVDIIKYTNCTEVLVEPDMYG